MKTATLIIALWLNALSLAQAALPASIECDACDEWNAAAPTFKIAPSIYYVGTQGLSALLVDTGEGLVIIDGGLPQSADRIANSVQQLGFQMTNVRYLLSSHEHFDHAGGLAKLQQRTGAPVLASTIAAPFLRMGSVSPDDPQAGYGKEANYPPIAKVTGVRDGQKRRLGNVEMTAIHTPAHSPGSTSWQITRCEDAKMQTACVTVLYADSLNPVSAPDFRFSDAKARVKDFRAALKKVRQIRCDVVISPHPAQSDLWPRYERSISGEGLNAFRDERGCAGPLADAAAERLRLRLGDESKAR
jgi:metallo-beta-lactamase class B